MPNLGNQRWREYQRESGSEKVAIIQGELTLVLGLQGPFPSLASEQEIHVCEAVGQLGRRLQSQFLGYEKRPYRSHNNAETCTETCCSPAPSAPITEFRVVLGY